MIVYDIFTREGIKLNEHGDGSFRYLCGAGEVWITTVSNKEIAVEKYCQTAVHVIRDRIGTVAECEDLD